MFTQQALTILMFLLPGFLCITVLDMLTPARKRFSTQYVVNALIYSLIIYAVYSAAFKDFPILLIEKTVKEETQYTLQFLKGSVIFLIIISIVIPCLLALSIKFDLHMKLFRFLKITDRTSRISLWFDIFTTHKDYVVITYKDGKRLYGWPEYYSDEAEDKSLFISRASWLDQNNNMTKIGGRGVLFPTTENIETVMFRNSMQKKQGDKNDEQKK